MLKIKKLQKNFTSVLIFIFYTILSFFSVRLLLSTGTVGMRHDWSLPPYPEQIKNYISGEIFLWSDLQSHSWDRRNLIYYKIFEGIVGLPARFNGDIISKVIIVLLILISGLCMYFLARKIISSEPGGFIAGLFYMLTPIVFNIIAAGHTGFLFSYALSPLVFLLFVKGIEKYNLNWRYIILSGLVYGVAFAQHQFILLLPFLICIWLFVSWVIEKNIGLKELKAFFSILGLGLAMHVFWIIPLLFGSGVSLRRFALLGYHGLINTPTISEAIIMIGWLHPYDYTDLIRRGIIEESQILLLYLLAILAIISLLSKKNHKEKIFAALILLIGVFMVTALNPPAGGIFEFLYTNFSIFRIFRDPDNCGFFISFSLSLLGGMFTAEVLKRFDSNQKHIQVKRISIIGIIVLIVLAAGYPILSGNFMGQTQTFRLPTNYKSMYNDFSSDDELFRILFVPSMQPIKYPDNKFSGIDTMILFPPKPSFPQNVDRLNRFNRFHSYTILSLREGKDIRNLLDVTSIRYIILRPEYESWYYKFVPGSEDLEAKIWGHTNFSEELFRASDSYEEIGELILYRRDAPPFFGITKPYLLIGSLETINKMPKNFIGKSSLIYTSDVKNSELNPFGSLLIDGRDVLTELTLGLNNSTQVIGLSTEELRPEKGWAFDDRTWWQFPEVASQTPNYGISTVLTTQNLTLTEGIKPTRRDLIREWDFETGLNGWKYRSEDYIAVISSDNAYKGNKNVKVTTNRTEQPWSWIRGPSISVKPGNFYQVVTHIKYENVKQSHIPIEGYNHDLGRWIQLSQIPHERDGTSGWTEYTSTVEIPSNITKIRVVLNAGWVKNPKLGKAKTWFDDIRVYDITKYIEPVTLKIPFSVDETDTYKLFIRYFKNQKGGEIKVYLDGKLVDITTKDQLNKFVWKELATCHLEKGEHTLVLENVKGFNAVNLFALIPEKEYEKSKEEISEILHNKTIIYLFEAESDMYSDNANISKTFGGEASNGEVLEIGDGKVWQEIEIIKNGTYRLAISAKGDFRVKIGDKKFEFHNSNLTYWYSPIIELNRGKYNLTITPSGTPMANFSFEPVSNIETEIIERLPAGIVSFSTDSYSGDSSLEVTSNVTEEGWLWLYTPEVNVTPGERYSAITHMKYKNVVESYISIEGYNKTAGEWIELMQVPSGQTGTSDWEEYKQILTIPEDISKIRFVLNAGWINDQEVGNATTWFDDISVYPVKDYLDVVWLYSTKNNETLNELFKTNETPASIMEYTKIDPTKYEVKVNATEPFMLSFAEAYDPLWEARIYKDGEKVEVVKSIPLYSVINGFWVEETGDLEIEIRYKPQDWFEMGLWISVTTFIGCIGYLFYDWRRGKGGKWALRIEARRHNAGNVVNKGFREGVRRLKKKFKRKKE